MADFINQFKKSLETGFIDHKIGSELLYQPKLLTNSKNPRKKILTTLLWELQTCERFFISVAFVTTGGVAAIINVLYELEQKNVGGEIVVSQYLNFTQPEALKRLLQFKNIKLRIATNEDAHSKGYLFKKKDHYSLIVGSSNLTQTALSSNKEWNLQVAAIKNSKIIHQVQKEFESDFKSATPVTLEFINEYEKIYEKKRLTLSKFVNENVSEGNIQPNAMQIAALNNLKNIRSANKEKALIISATGTGKTFLAAFDAMSQQPKKLLFVVHRLNIAKKAMKTFEKVYSGKKSMGIYSGNKRELDKEFLFSTVQTISKLDHLKVFEPDHFDYIIIDEAHRAGAQSYMNLIEYFTPRFLLGMTATPERTDGADIFKLFDHNIAYEIRLNDAMEKQMLSPFHYYGVSDLYIDEEEQNDITRFNKLTSDERVDRIVEKSKFYGTDNGLCRGLVFVSIVSEAQKLSKKFNGKGFRTIALSGSNSNDERALAIELLESDNESERLDYIFTVDIFNEGIDIPKVNQIIMLRPTESAIIFVQQLGRGLRKLEAKSYLTVIDFIGNHNNNYLIPIALYGDTSFNKDKLRKLLSDGSTELPGVSTVNFDRISKEKIFESIDSANMRLLMDLKKDYSLLKHRLGRYPLMMDFINSNSRDPYHFVKYSKSYYNFVFAKMKDEDSSLNLKQLKLLELFNKEINNSVRVEESLLLKHLVEKGAISIYKFKEIILKNYEYDLSENTIQSCVWNLNFKFIREKKEGSLLSVKEIYKLEIVNIVDDRFILENQFKSHLKNATFKKFLLDSINYGCHKFDELYIEDNWRDGFVLYRKYSRKDVFRILNVPTNPVAQNVGGYLVSKDNKHCPIFSTLHKADDISTSTKYEDKFINPSVFQYMSKNNRRKSSKDVQSILGKNGPIRLPLFIKKNNDEGDEFYYMGEVNPIVNETEETTMKNDAGNNIPVVKLLFQIKTTVVASLFSYLQEPITNIEINGKVNVKSIESAPSVIKENNEFKIPLYDFYAAAGSFSEMQTSKEYTMTEVPEKYEREGYFACKVIGESMNRRIPNGSICIFKNPVVGSKTGKILLLECYDKQDPDMQSHFTIKTYSSSKVITDGSWKHEKILLKPNSYDDSFEEIIISEEDAMDNKFNVVGEFVGILS